MKVAAAAAVAVAVVAVATLLRPALTRQHNGGWWDYDLASASTELHSLERGGPEVASFRSSVLT